MDPELMDRVYLETGIPLDKLPYTEKFEQMYEAIAKVSGSTISKQELWKVLQDRRKRGLLPRLGR